MSNTEIVTITPDWWTSLALVPALKDQAVKPEVSPALAAYLNQAAAVLEDFNVAAFGHGVPPRLRRSMAMACGAPVSQLPTTMGNTVRVEVEVPHVHH